MTSPPTDPTAGPIRHHPHPTTALLGADPIAGLARHLLAAMGRTGTTANLLVGADTQGVLDIRLAGPRPEDELCGWLAPATWDAALLLTNGRRTPGGTAAPLALIADRHHLPQVLLEGELLRCVPGLLTDVLQRSIGQGTPSPHNAVSDLANAVWLHRLLDMGADHPCPAALGWSSVAARHPAHRFHHVSPSRLAILNNRLGWRQLARTLVDTALCVPRPLCAWFDAGSFERWLLPRLPEPADILSDLHCLLHPELMLAVETVVARRAPTHSHI